MATAKLFHPWLALFPATYLLHILEEYFAGEGFYRWISRITDVSLTGGQFLSMNAVLWVIMICAIFAVHSYSTGGWIVIGLAALVCVNGLGHALATLRAGSYSPGMVTGLIVWVPLGIYALIRTAPLLPAWQLWIGVAAGLLTQAAVSLLALAVGRSNRT
jgi:hypothetical protein